MKIKVKKEVTIVDLLALHYAKKIKPNIYTSNNGGRVVFKLNGLYDMELVSHEDMFKVEVEEEIDEDTKVPTLIELFVSDYGQIIHTYYRTSIKEAIGDVEDDAKALSKAFYILNDDYTMTLIWKNGGMVK